MGESLKVRNSGFLRFSTVQGEYFFNSLERALYRIKDIRQMAFTQPVTLDPRPFYLPKADSIESILSKDLSQLVLNFTEQCNLRCKYCIYGEAYKAVRGYSNKEMKVETALKAIDYFLPRSKAEPFITFYGGEPTLRLNEIIRIIDLVRSKYPDKGVKFSVVTNATLLNEKNIEELFKRGIFIQISVDGPQDIHDFNRVFQNGGGTFDKIYSVVRHMFEKYPEYYKTHIMFELTLTPGVKIQDVRNFINSPLFENNLFKIGFLDPDDNTYVHKFCTREDQERFQEDLKALHKLFCDDLKQKGSTDRFLWALFGKRPLDIHMLLGSKPEPYIPLNGTCIPGARKLYVDVDGKFYPCEKVRERLEIGSVEEGINIRKVMSLLEKYREISEDCRFCFAKDLCRICFALIASPENELSLHRKIEFCRRERQEIESALVTYAEIMEANPGALNFLADYEFQ